MAQTCLGLVIASSRSRYGKTWWPGCGRVIQGGRYRATIPIRRIMVATCLPPTSTLRNRGISRIRRVQANGYARCNSSSWRIRARVVAETGCCVSYNLERGSVRSWHCRVTGTGAGT
jgi:hypothetical protein